MMCKLYFILALLQIRSGDLRFWVDTVQEASGLIPGRGGHKNLCGCRGPDDYVSFRRAVKTQLFLNLKNTIQSHEQH